MLQGRQSGQSAKDGFLAVQLQNELHHSLVQ
jgi:hypothetical protein